MLRAQGQIDEALAVCQHALAAAAATGDMEVVAGLLGQYGNIQKGTGDLASCERTFRRGIAVAATAPWVEADLLNDLAAVLVLQGRTEDAQAAVRRALDVRTAIGDEVGRAGALSNLATFAPPREAEGLYAEALSIFDRLGDEPGRANIFINLGKLHRATRDWARSYDSYDSAHVIGDLIGDRRLVAMALHGQAVARDEQRTGDAARLYREALQIAEDIGFTSESASIHNNLARYYRDQGDADRTLQERQQALALYELLNSTKGKAETWYGMGVDAYQAGRVGGAIEPFRLAFEACTALKDPLHRLEAGNNYAAALYDNERIEESSRLYEMLLPEAETPQTEMHVRIIIGLGKCAFRMGRGDEAIRYFRDGVEKQLWHGGLAAAWALADELSKRLASDFGCPTVSRLDLLGSVLNRAAKQLAAAGKYDDALGYLEPLRNMAMKNHDSSWLARALVNIGYVQRDAGRTEEAIRSLTSAIPHYRDDQDAKGALVPLSHLLPLLEERQDHDGTAAAWEELGLCYDALDERVKGAEAYARAAGFWLLPFASNEIRSLKEARERAGRAHQLLVEAQPLLVYGSPAHDRATYDLAFCKRVIQDQPV